MAPLSDLKSVDRYLRCCVDVVAAASPQSGETDFACIGTKAAVMPVTQNRFNNQLSADRSNPFLVGLWTHQEHQNSRLCRFVKVMDSRRHYFLARRH